MIDAPQTFLEILKWFQKCLCGIDINGSSVFLGDLAETHPIDLQFAAAVFEIVERPTHLETPGELTGARGVGDSIGIADKGGNGGPFTPQAARARRKLRVKITIGKYLKRRDGFIEITVSRTEGF
jgi:hypothetical protein